MDRDFKGIFIPKSIWLDTRLNGADKMTLMEIDSLDNNCHCYASNEYLAEFIGCSIGRIQSIISKLKKLGYIRQIKFDGRSRYLKSNIRTIISEETK